MSVTEDGLNGIGKSEKGVQAPLSPRREEAGVATLLQRRATPAKRMHGRPLGFDELDVFQEVPERVRYGHRPLTNRLGESRVGVLSPQVA